MKFLDTQSPLGTTMTTTTAAAILLLLALPCESKHAHSLNHLNILGKRHQQRHANAQFSPRAVGLEHPLQKRAACQFPTDKGLVPVTPGALNAGWAMSPDQQCVPDSFCPFACPSGQVMAQWNPTAINYPDPKSMDGGLYCNINGDISLPFPDKPLCKDGTGTVGAKNECKGTVSFCQTVLPGNEAMIIPTAVDTWTQLAVPGADYWLSTAAHYYVNFPGIGVTDACVWGDGVVAKGNWAPYVAGANTKADGTTFSMISWNPIFLESWHAKTTPTFGLRIECLTGNCMGLPCSIDPTSDGVGGVNSGNMGTGAGGANFCVVTLPPGGKANVVTFPVGGADVSKDDPSKVTQSSTSTTTAKPDPTTTSKTVTKSSSSTVTTATEDGSSTESSDSASATGFQPHILFEKTNYTTTTTTASSTRSATLSATAQPTASTSKNSGAAAVSGSMFSFLVVFAAAAYIL